MSDNDRMQECVIALTDALKTVFEILVAKRLVSVEAAAGMLRKQREAYERGPPLEGAMYVMDSLLGSLTDPLRAEARKLLEDPFQGSA
jgi:hypothetical protein